MKNIKITEEALTFEIEGSTSTFKVFVNYRGLPCLQEINLEGRVSNYTTSSDVTLKELQDEQKYLAEQDEL